MSVTVEEDLEEVFYHHLRASNGLASAQRRELVTRITFIRHSLEAGKNYPWIAAKLGISANAARRFYERNHIKVSRRAYREEVVLDVR